MKTCFTHHLEHDFSQGTCALAVYLNDWEAVTKLCKTILIVNEEP